MVFISLWLITLTQNAWSSANILFIGMGTLSENHTSIDSTAKKRQNVRICFWNIENLFDTYNDTTRLDEDFTPGGMKHWGYSKFSKKINNLAKTILAIGEWNPPAIAGMCEVENRYVLSRLVSQTPLKSYNYEIIHFDSPDRRGIDVAMIYRPAIFSLLSVRSIPVRFPFDTLVLTREILMVTGKLFGSDTLTVFINHWPSRMGGSVASQPKRNYVASLVRRLTDSIFSRRPDANILIMGDFNDEPTDESLLMVLGATLDPAHPGDAKLINLMGPKVGHEGTHKFQGHWAILDQMIVSPALLNERGRIRIRNGSASIFKAGFILKEDSRFFGDKPSRTYNGPKYEGGFSDHLPIYLDIGHIGP